jgi:hypothetical protein
LISASVTPGPYFFSAAVAVNWHVPSRMAETITHVEFFMFSPPTFAPTDDVTA